MPTFKIEVTDTYGGEANYCWIKRFEYKANTMRGAIHQLARDYGAGWKLDYNGGDMARYNLKGACICCFVEYSEGE